MTIEALNVMETKKEHHLQANPFEFRTRKIEPISHHDGGVIQGGLSKDEWPKSEWLEADRNPEKTMQDYVNNKKKKSKRNTRT